MTPDEMREIKQRANAAELPNDHTVNLLKGDLRECLAEIAALDAELVIEREARLFYFNKLADLQILKQAKDTELERLEAENQHFAELIDQAPHDNLCARQWTDAGVPRPCDCWKKEAEEALKC